MTRIREWIQRGWASKWVVAGRDYLRRYGVITALAIALIYSIGPWRYSHDWTGFRGDNDGATKKLWDWLDLLVVPIVLAVGAYLFNRRAAIRDKEREEAAKEREKAWEEATRYEEILQEYLDDMSQLLMKEGLKAALKKRNKKPKQEDETKADGESEGKPETEADEELPVVDIARARTVNTLRRLKDPQRRRELLDFLQDAGLYNGETALLRNAKMDGINLDETNLEGIDLGGASLIEAHLVGAVLAETVLVETVLARSHLAGAYMWKANLIGASLVRANLTGAFLWEANLRGASLTGANLTAAFLAEADLKGANLIGANLTGADVGEADQMWPVNPEIAEFDETTHLPDGTKWHEGVDWTQWTEPKKAE